MNICKWEQLHKKHLDWAYKAKAEFIDDFEIDEFRDLFVFNNQDSQSNINVVVYGESQQGKTSFIFNLLGINDEKLIEIFRMGNKKGKSATKTAMIYLKSEDENFYYKDSENYICFDSLDKLENKLIELKTKVENKKANTTPVRIKIPKKFFTKENDLKINIIDLPGIGSRNKQEKAHVLETIHNLVPHANVILIVTTINNVVHLGSNSFMNLKIDDWRDFPERFRIILTHCGTDGTTRRLLDNNEISTKEEFRSYLKDKFTKSVENTPENIKLYPIENFEEKKIPKNLFDDFETELIEDINNTETESDYLKRFSDYWKNLEKAKHTQLKVFDKKIEKAKIDLIEIKKKINKTSNYLKNLNMTMEIEIDFLNILIKGIKKEEFIFNKKMSKPNKKTANELKRKFEKFISEIKKEAKKFQINFNDKSSIRKISLEIEDFVNSNKKNIYTRKQLNKYWFKDSKYREKNYSRDLELCSIASDSIIKSITSAFKAKIRKITNDFEINNRNKKKEFNIKINKTKKLLEDLRNDKIKYLSEKRKLSQRIRNYNETAIKDIDKAKKYKEKMLTAYKQEEKRIYEDINSKSSNAVDNFFSLMQLTLENKRMIEIVGGIDE